MGWILVEGAQEDEDVASLRAINEISRGHIALLSGRQEEKFSALAGIRPRQPHITGKGRGYRQMVMVVDHAKLFTLAEAARVAPRILQGLKPGRQGMTLSTKPNAAACIAETFGKMLDRAAAGQIEADQGNFEDLVHDALLSLVDHTDFCYGRPPAAVIVQREPLADTRAPSALHRGHSRVREGTTVENSEYVVEDGDIIEFGFNV